MARKQNKNNQQNRKQSRKQNNRRQAIDKMKTEIANELGINVGADSSSRENGSVGGEITKRLVQMGQERVKNSKKSKNSRSK